MHNPSSTPWQSLYYRYQVYPFRQPAEFKDKAKRWPVAIVGAGPAGLISAIFLAQFGVDVVLLEAERQVSQGSRAIVFTRRTLEILQQIGVAGRLTDKGLPWRCGNTYYRGQCVFRMEAPHDESDRFWPLLNIQQQYLEQYLIERAAELPNLELRWASKITRIAACESEVRLGVDTPAGEYELRADWVVAADGARSALRDMLGLRLEGASYEGRFVIADIAVDLDLPTERLAFFDPPWNRGNTVLMHREPGGIWRIDYRLPDGESPEQVLNPESLTARINAQLAMIGAAGRPWALDWSSVYSARALTLPDYFCGRVGFVGDAAHVLPIFGVRGANTGAQDCQNLAWKLACVVRGWAGAALLNSYSKERVQAAREIIHEASRSTRFMTPPTRGYRLLRDATLSLSLSQSFVQPLLHWRTSRPHQYPDSPLNADDSEDSFLGGIEIGAPVKNIRLGPDSYLLDQLDANFHLIYFGGRSIPAWVAPALDELRRNGPTLRLITDPERIGAQLGVGEGWYLVRPDQHVCGRWRQLDAARLRAAMDRALSRVSGEYHV